MSPISCSMPSGPLSDSPDPRLSQMMSRENCVRRVRKRAKPGFSQMCSTCEMNELTSSRSIGPSPCT